MARIPALFNGPIDFTNPGSGKQISLPLSAVFFDGGNLKAEGQVYTDNQAIADGWLKYLAGAGLLRPNPSSPSQPALLLTAKDAGSLGNFIQITFSNFVIDADPTKTKFDVTVTETDTYTGLKPSTIQSVLGAAAGAGSQPGLVFVPGGPITDLPAAVADLALAGDPATIAVPKGGGGNAFSVQAKASGTDGALTKITIKDVTATTFTLIATWNKSKSGIKVADIQPAFGYEITVAAPNGGVLQPPAPGAITLSGGSDAVSLPPTKASANLVTG